MRTVRLPTVSCGIQGVEVGTHPLQVSCLGVGWVPIPGHTHPPPRHTHDSQKRSWDQRYPTPPRQDMGPGTRKAPGTTVAGTKYYHNTVADPGVPRGKGANPEVGAQHIILAIFPR